jgi:hypothetical protein
VVRDGGGAVRPDTERVTLMDTAVLRILQADARRCMSGHALGGLPADETCAAWADRCQDELDRRAAGVPLPEALAGSLGARYDRTGPHGTERDASDE